MNDESPPPVDGDGDGASPCAWCGKPVRQPGTGRPREYCRRSCRQRAYENRQVQQRIAVATQAALAIARDEQRAAAAEAAADSSRDDQATPGDSSRVDSGDAGDSSRDDEAAEVPEPRPAQAPAPRARPRRMWDVPPSAADQMPLFGRSRSQQSDETK